MMLCEDVDFWEFTFISFFLFGQGDTYKVIPIHRNGVCITQEGFEAVVGSVAQVIAELKELLVEEGRTDFSAAGLFAEFSSTEPGVGRHAMHQLGIQIMEAFVPIQLRKMFSGNRGTWTRNNFTDKSKEAIDGECEACSTRNYYYTSTDKCD